MMSVRTVAARKTLADTWRHGRPTLRHICPGIQYGPQGGTIWRFKLCSDRRMVLCSTAGQSCFTTYPQTSIQEPHRLSLSDSSRELDNGGVVMAFSLVDNQGRAGRPFTPFAVASRGYIFVKPGCKPF